MTTKEEEEDMEICKEKKKKKLKCKATNIHKPTKYHEQMQQIERKRAIYRNKGETKTCFNYLKIISDIEYDGLGWLTTERQREINTVVVIHGGGSGGGRI